MQGDPRRTVSGSRPTIGLAITALALGTAGCTPAEPQPAGQPVSAARTIARLGKIEAAAATGDLQTVQQTMKAIGFENFHIDMKYKGRILCRAF